MEASYAYLFSELLYVVENPLDEIVVINNYVSFSKLFQSGSQLLHSWERKG